jgi:ABC-2 type transport system permease protein
MWSRLWALTQKEIIQMLRDAKSIPLVVIGCAVEMILFAFAVHTSVGNIPMVVVDQSMSPASRSYISAFVESGSFELAAMAENQSSAIHAVDSGQASIGLIIPPDFARQVLLHSATVLMLVDGSSAFTSQSAYRSAQAISQAYAVSLVGHAAQADSPLTTYIQILYNPDLKDLWVVVPGFFAMIFQAISMNFTSLAVVREREAGTIEALLVTPIRPIELMLAKTLPNLALALVNTLTLMITSILILGVPFRGSLALFVLLALLNACCGLVMGLAISTLVSTQNQSQQLAGMVNITGMFLAGVMYPVYSMPLLLRWIGYIFPNTYFVPIARGIFLKGTGLPDLWPQALAMVVLFVALLFIATRLFRQSLD